MNEEWTEEVQRRTEEGQKKRERLLKAFGCAPEGRRDLDLSIGDRVQFTGIMGRHTFTSDDRPSWRTGEVMFPDREAYGLLEGSDVDVLRLWCRQDVHSPEPGGALQGFVVGARTLQSGCRVEGTSRTGLPEDYVQPYLDIWRTHRVYIVTEGLWKEHVKVLSDDIGGEDE